MVLPLRSPPPDCLSALSSLTCPFSYRIVCLLRRLAHNVPPLRQLSPRQLGRMPEDEPVSATVLARTYCPWDWAPMGQEWSCGQREKNIMNSLTMELKTVHLFLYVDYYNYYDNNNTTISNGITFKKKRNKKTICGKKRTSKLINNCY